MKKIILLSSVAVASGVLFANIFNSMVIAVAAGSDIPNSVLAPRDFSNQQTLVIFLKYFLQQVNF